MYDLKLMAENERKVIEARRTYQKQWRAANQDKVKAAQNRFWLKKAAEQQKGDQQNNNEE